MTHNNQYGWTDNGKVIHITNEAYASILTQAKADAPIESCGYALGIIEADGTPLITQNYPLTNTDHAQDHFTLDPKEQFAALKHARASGLKVIGPWHSHPASPSRPSEEDKRLALDPHTLYLIISLTPGDSGLPYVTDKTQPVLNAFRIKNGEVERYGVQTAR